VDLSSIVRVLLRRWPFSVVALLLTGVVGWALVILIGPTHQASSTFVMMPPAAAVQAAADNSAGGYSPNNPLLYLSGLNDTRDLLVQTLGAPDTARATSEEHGGATFTAAGNPALSGPILVLEVKANSAADAFGALHDLGARVPTGLESLQNQLEVASSARISALELTVDKKAVVSHKRQIMYAGAGTAVTALGSFLAVATLDGILGRRRAKAQEDPAPTARPDVDDD
jgi:hypothetical protein